MKYLTSYRTIIPISQRLEFEKYLQQRVDKGQIRSEMEFGSQLKDAVGQIDPSNKPIFIVNLANRWSRTNSEIYNKMMDDAKIDLFALFKENNLSNYILGLQENISKDFNDSVYDAIINLQGEIASQKVKFENKVGQKITIYESFTDVTGKTLMDVGVRHGALTLDNYSAEVHIYTLEDAKVHRYPGAGVNLFVSAVNDVELNPSVLQPGLSQGYWAEAILSDVIPTLRFQDDDIVPWNKLFRGILIILRLTFATPISMNALDVDPFTIFDIRIPWLRYKLEDSEDWNYVVKNNTRINGIGREIINFRNFDRINHVKILEIPFWQVNAYTNRYTISTGTKEELDLWEDILNGKYKNVEASKHEALYNPTEETNYDAATYKLFEQKNLSESLENIAKLLGIESKEFKHVGSKIVLEDLKIENPFFAQSEKYEYVYGTYSILPMDIKYKPIGAFLSSPINIVEQPINSFSISATEEEPAICSINYFVKLDSGQKYALVPKGKIRVREHLPIASDERSFPRTYYTDSLSSEEYTIQTGCEIKRLNKFIPTFYIDDDEAADVYRNGIWLSGVVIDPKERYAYVDVTGTLSDYREIVASDVIMIEYDMDPLYQPPGKKQFNPFYSETEGIADTYILSLEGGAPLDIYRGYDLYVGFPNTQWFLMSGDAFTVTENTILISGGIVQSLVNECEIDVTGIKFMFEYYSTVDDFNGNLGRRDFAGSPYIVDLIQAHTCRSKIDPAGSMLDTGIPIKTLSLQRFSGKFKLTNYVIELPFRPIIDFRLYNYNGTWKNEPGTEKTYSPVEVKIGDIPAVDKTNYFEKHQSLHPYNEIGQYEFYLEKNKIYFNAQVANADVTISFRYIGKIVNLLIEYNTNVMHVSSYTPVVQNYILNLGTINV